MRISYVVHRDQVFCANAIICDRYMQGLTIISLACKGLSNAQLLVFIPTNFVFNSYTK